jgi:hypothetical protein
LSINELISLSFNIAIGKAIGNRESGEKNFASGVKVFKAGEAGEAGEEIF